MKIYLVFLLTGLSAFAFAQKPNNSNRLPVTPDMPEWAKALYHDDLEVNAFALDAAFEPWSIVFDSLKLEMAKAGDLAGDDLRRQFEHYKQYYKYYTRWRARVSPYLLPDGSLDFTIQTDKDLEPQLQQAAKSSSSNWSFVGPVITRWRQNDNAAQPHAPWQVNIYCVDVAPSNANILYCGSESGVVNKTIDKGLNWTPVGANFFTNNIGAIAIHPTNPDTVYVSELSARIQSTADGGTTWSTALNISNFNCEDIKIKPDEPEVVLAAGSSLQRRTVGNIWTNVLNMKSYDVAFKPNDPSVVYVLVKNTVLDLCEFWKSTDGGQTWSIRSTGWITGLTDGGGRLTVTPADNDRIYCVLLTGSGPRVMRSNDAGENWTIIASSSQTGLIGPCTTGALSMTNGQGFFDLSIAASHTNADHIILGTTTSFKSTDGGVTYSLLGGYCGPFNTHPDFQEMRANGTDTWIVTDGGVNLSTDFYTDPTIDLNYFVRINNLRGSEHWGFDAGWNEDVLVGGRYHNGNTAWRETYPAGDFLRMGGGEAPTGYVNPGNPSMTYFSDLGGRILPTTNTQPVGSFTVSKWPNENFYPMEGAEQKWDPRYMYTYYLGNGNQFWKTTDNGLNFTSLFTHSSSTAEIRYVEVSRSNPNVIYFTVNVTGPDDGQLWKTTDGGANWTQCSNPGTLTASQRRFSKITMSGTDENTLWWCFRTGPNGQKVFKSTDGGSTWVNWTTTALDNMNATDILHQLGTDGGVYFLSGSGSKVLYRDNPATDWTVYNTDLPLNLYGNFGGVFAKPYYKGGKLRLGTGNGIWEADLFTTSTTTLVQPMVDNATPNCSRDTIQLESYSVVNGAATYQWSLSPAPQYISNPNIRNPRVVLGSTPGFYSATLTVTDNNGVTTRTVNNLINNLAGGNLCGADTIPGKALSLDGSGDYAVPNASLNLNSNTVSMTAWVKRDGAQVDFSGLVYARGGTTSSGLSITSANALRYTWNDAAGSYGFNTGFTIPDNVWTHIALVITANNAKVYMNGVAATRTATHLVEEFNTPVQIGFDQGTRYFKGQIDEVTVWNKSLTQDEVRDLMHLTLDPTGQANLVSYYQFNEPSGNAMDKVGTRHAALVGNATRVVSTGPFGGGKSSRQSVTTGGPKTFTAAEVVLGFPAAGTYPNGEVVVNRINLEPDSLPPCSAYHSDDHYWIIDNYGTNQTFTALDSMRLGNFLVPATDAISPLSYKLKSRTTNAHLLPWTDMASTSIGATGGANGRITFGTASAITQFGQFLATNTLPGQIITGPASVCSGGNASLDAGAGYSSYSWSDGGGSGQMATYLNLTTSSTYTVTVTDANGCTGSAMKTVTVNPLPTPTISGPTSVCSGGNATLDAGAGYTTYAWSNSGGSGQTAMFTNITTTTTYTVTVTDGNGCQGTDTHTVTVNPLPTPTSRGPASVCSGGSATLDAGAGYSTYAWSNSGGSGQTAMFTNITTTTTYTVTVTDGNGCQGTDTHTVAVSGNLTPTVTGPASVCSGGSATLDAGAGYSTYAWSNSGGSGQTAMFTNITTTTTYTVTVTDGNGCQGTDTHTVTVNPLPTPTISGPTSVCSGGNATLDAGAGYTTYAWSNSGGSSQTAMFTNITTTTTYTVTVTDGNGCQGTDTHTVAVSGNLTPTVTGPASVCSGGSATLDAGAGYSTYAWSNSGGSGQTAMFTNITTTTTYTVTVTDGNGCTGTDTHTVTVPANEPPTITCPDPVNVSCSSQAPPVNLAAPTASDDCGTPTISHDGDATSNQTCTNRKTVTRTYRATDSGGLTATCAQVITVFDNVMPVFTSVPINVTVQCNSVPAVGSPSASDGCGGAVSIAYDGQTVSNVLCTDKYTLTRKWTATDACGNTKAATQRIVVTDTQLPNFTSTPSNVTVQCNAIPTVAAPTATDNCDTAVAMSYNGQTITPGSCPNAYTLTRRWTAADNCGNTRSISQRITVVDNGKPVFTALPSNITIGCTAPIPPVGSATATDGCAGVVTVIYLGQTTVSGTCPASYQIRRTWRATDVCGNSTAATQTIQVSDGGVPVFTSTPGPLTIGCTDPLPALVNPTATDACGGYVHITFIGNVATGSGCAADYTVTRTWRADDLCGNSATTMQVITVLGNSYGPQETESRAKDKLKNQSLKLKNVTLQPNPTTDRVWIDLSEFRDEAVTVSIYSDLGRLVWENNVPLVRDQILVVSLREAGAAMGVYTVSVRSASGVAATRVVLVE
ncbi:MAG: LamG-like jellyroll fold domain-containing protein [Saprospiraceae bacterium]